MSETTRTYLPDTQDDLIDTATVTPNEGRKVIRDLIQAARLAASVIGGRGMPNMAKRLRELADMASKHTT